MCPLPGKGSDLLASIDLGEDRSISRMSLGCLQNYNDWIFMPHYVKFEISADEKNYKEVAVEIYEK